jgi:phage terminase Nu1 subunit (DNA packaging protein)
MSTEHFIWDPPAAPEPGSVALRGLTKGELATALGITPAVIGKLVREGAPFVPGSGGRAGHRYDIPDLVQWLIEEREKPAPTDPLTLARQRKAEAEAEKIEIANKKAAGGLWDAELVKDAIRRNVARLRTYLLDVPDRLTGAATAVRDQVRNEIAGAFERANIESLSEGDHEE